jgi:hypothetical protein
MTRHIRILSVGTLALATLLATASNLWAIPFSQKKIIIEVNATAGDGGIQIFLDAVGWNRLQISDPDGRNIFQVTGSGSVGTTGVTELFFESAEPSFEDLPLDQLLVRFPAGNYTFSGTTVDGRNLNGRAPLKHNIPAGPTVTSPDEGATLDPGSPVVIDWEPVTDPFPGTILPVTISGYQVIVERVRPAPLLVFSVFLPASATGVTVPAEFIEGNADYIFEVLAIEASGNQTITESSFETAAGRAAKAPDNAKAEPQRGAESKASKSEASGTPLGPTLLENRPNPFNPSTAFDFALSKGGLFELRVFDIQGRVVRTLVSGELPAGNHRATWDGTDERGRAVASGVYIATLSGPGGSESRRIVLAR